MAHYASMKITNTKTEGDLFGSKGERQDAIRRVCTVFLDVSVVVSSLTFSTKRTLISAETRLELLSS
jgi:hypothetical protein